MSKQCLKQYYFRWHLSLNNSKQRGVTICFLLQPSFLVTLFHCVPSFKCKGNALFVSSSLAFTIRYRKNFKPFVPCILSTYGIKTNWCHYFNFIYILPDLYTFRVHRPILRRVYTAVHTTIGSVSVLIWPCLCTAPARAVQILNQWWCEQLCELSWGWACGPETCRDPAIYK